MSIEVYPFRYRDPLTGRWVRARYKASKGDLAARYPGRKITGQPELREPLDATFTPSVRPAGKPASAGSGLATDAPD